MKNSTLKGASALLTFALMFVASASMAQLANDDCSGAITITYAADSAACSPTTGTTVGATQSADPADVCSGSWFDDDVWFTFTTPATMPTAVVVRMYLDSAISTDIVNPGMALYAGCGNAEMSIACFSGGNDRLLVLGTDLAASTQYWVRCWSSNVTNPNGGTFSICAYGDNSLSTACSIGTLTTPGPLDQCPGDTVNITVTGNQIPSLGGFGYQFAPGTGATGGITGGFTLTGAVPSYTFDEDLNGVLSSNNLPVLTGQWFITPVIYSDAGAATGSVCDSTLASVTVNFLPASDPNCGGIGIEENVLAEQFDIYPNPSNGLINFSTELWSIDAMRIIGLDGKLVKDLGTWSASNGQQTLDLRNLQDGVYMLELTQDGQRAMKRFVITH